MDPRAEHEADDRPQWQTPQLVRLGTLRDIAQPGSAFDQGASGKGVPVAS